MTKKQVREILSQVNDPELNVNIVDLGLIYDIGLKPKSPKDKARVQITMTLTTPGCPLGGWFVETVRRALVDGLKIKSEQVMVEITFDPPWSQELMSEEAKAQLGF